MKKNILYLSFLLATSLAVGQHHIDTGSGSNPHYISRNTATNQAFKMTVDDRVGLMQYSQDETSGSHDWVFNLASPSTGTLAYSWKVNSEIFFLLSKNGFYFNAHDPNNAGLRILFDKTTNNNGADVDLTIDSNSGAPKVDWFVKNWAGSYVFNRGTNDGSGGTTRKELFKIDTDGNISLSGGAVSGSNGQSLGIGTNGKAVYVSTDIESSTWRDQIGINSNSSTGYGIAFSGQGHHRGGIFAENAGGTASPMGSVTVWARNSGNIILDGGKVGIGTTSPDEKLTVAGNIHAQEVKVTIGAGTGPDYVFEPDYNLPTLASIETFIKSEKHLPEIPSAVEMEANGVRLGEMNMLLLKKIEELTLHLIEMKKENQELLSRVENLERK